MTVEKIRPRTADEMAATIRAYVCQCEDAYCTRRNEVDLLLAKAKQAAAELDLTRDTLRHRTAAHQRVIDTNTQLRATVAACPHCAKEHQSE